MNALPPAQHCVRCHASFVPSAFSPGYGEDNASGQRYCYDCCAVLDREFMKRTGRTVLYLSHPTIPTIGVPFTEAKLTNWPGTLRFDVSRLRKGRHNIARTRYDVWFTFEGENWHGVQYGENTQLCHCRRIA